MKPIALVTAQAARELDEDLAPLTDALTRAGIEHEILCWDDKHVDWSKFHIALLRSPWDYVPRLNEFLVWASRVSMLTRLLNPLEIVHWNTDKHYLLDLQNSGVAIVPSHFIEPQPNYPGMDTQMALGAALDFPENQSTKFEEYVIKPAVGAGSKDAARYHRDDHARAIAHVQQLLDQQRSVLIQPYLDRVDEYGETALLYFNGEFSHAIRKGPLLTRAAKPTRALFAPEAITPRIPSATERFLADRAIKAIYENQRFQTYAPLLYTRVDLLMRDNGEPCLLELETTEPSLFFAHAEGAADNFVRAIQKHL